MIDKERKVNKERRKAWESLRKLLNQVHDKNKDADSEEVEKNVFKAIKNLRKKEED